MASLLGTPQSSPENCMNRPIDLEPEQSNACQRWVRDFCASRLGPGLGLGIGLGVGLGWALLSMSLLTPVQAQERAPESIPMSSPALSSAQDLAPEKSESELFLKQIEQRKNVLKAQMDEVENDTRQHMALCAHRFAVTDCQLDAQARRIERLKPLKDELLPLEDQERAIKAQDARDALANKHSEEALARESARILQAQAAHDQRLAQHQQEVLDHQRQADKAPKPLEPPSSQSPTREAQLEATRAYDQKLAKAREHQAQVQKHLREKTTRPKPLPAYKEPHTAETAHSQAGAGGPALSSSTSRDASP